MTILLLAPLLPVAAGQDSNARSLERELFRAFDAIRGKNKLSGFQPDSTLSAIAREHAQDMLRRNYFDHRSPDGTGPGDRVARHHRRLIGVVGENLWTGSGFSLSHPASLADRIAGDLMASRGHRRNILDSDFTHMGVGAAVQGEEIRVVQLFAAADAFLQSNLPARIRPGQTLDLAMVPWRGSRPAVNYDLSFSDGRLAAGPFPITSPFPRLASGEYLLRFYFPERLGTLKIVFGPSVRTP